MGNEITMPVEMNPNLGMFCLSLRPIQKIELIHAPPEVEDCVRRVANEVNGLETPSKDKLGALQFKMSGWLFVNGNGKEAATLGKLFCIRLLEELHKMGYDLEIGSDLTRAPAAAGSLFFRKVTMERPTVKVVCVAPGKADTIVLLNHSESVKKMVENAIKDAASNAQQEILRHPFKLYLEQRCLGIPREVWEAAASRHTLGTPVSFTSQPRQFHPFPNNTTEEHLLKKKEENVRK